MEFITFKQAVAAQFKHMSGGALFTTMVDKDDVWNMYLSSFPEGTNPIYRERTEHDCSCCKQFIRDVGNVVAIVNGKLVSIWDVELPCIRGYKDVAKALSELVKSYPIDNVFYHFEPTAGADKTFEQLTEGVKTWNHFFVNIPSRFVDRQPGAKMGATRSLHDVTLRGLTEITDDAIDTVLELINQNSLYRGEEHKNAVTTFATLKAKASVLAGAELDNFVWATCAASGGVGAIRNSVIGTLLVDLSEGVDMEQAVKSFESKVAPTNYKRPTALVTKAMVEKAKGTIAELGLTSALERRYATINDISVNNLLFVDRSTSVLTEDDPFAGVATKNTKSFDKVEEVSIDKFLSDILPTAKTLEVLVENQHANRMVSLIAPVDPTAGQLFKWDNGFSWSYAGDVTDSIKERVKQAGGNVTGELCCRLAWDNRDDLDFHMYEPGLGHIYYGVRRRRSADGGMLDVDANGTDGQRDNPVENIFYEKISTMRKGAYELSVHNYNLREMKPQNIEIEIDLLGEVHHFSYPKQLNDEARFVVAVLTSDGKGNVTLRSDLPSSKAVRSIWDIQSQDFRKVSTVMLSPNHWDGQGIGNKHYFFMLEGCANDGTARGFYNEFLKEELTPHRKVIEIVGSKMRTEESAHQLSGLGFSRTQRSTLICRVTGSFSRILKVNF